MSTSALPRSQWIGRVGSAARTAAAALRKQSPWPVSLPSDQMVTETLLRWKIALRSLRSTIERFHSGKRPMLPGYEQDSIGLFHSGKRPMLSCS